MEDLKQQMKHHFLSYASYVILDRAIPNVVDGLKPVQRRILATIFKMHDGKFHKVANIAGQTMALHPHGEAAIVDALVNMASKGFTLDMQGNFGNLYTGDPAAAARYIESRLSELSLETLFNPDLTETILSYDGRNKEPVTLPAKIPLLLMQGAEGIAVGMSTKILPHNFNELLEAEIAILEGNSFAVLPDFPTGGIMDASDYNRGLGKVKLRAKVEIVDPKTIIIKEICYGTTTESLMASIEEAAKKGKIKIESIHDFTSDEVSIEIKLPRGQYAEEVESALYAYTECEVSLNSQIVVIKDNLPWETDTVEVLKLNVELLKQYLQKELEIKRDNLHEKVFEKTLEQIFIENRLYKAIENIKKAEQIHTTVETSLVPYHKKLSRIPTYNDRERLLSIPIRRISKFDIERNEQEIRDVLSELEEVEKELKNVKRYTIRYLRGLIKKFGHLFPRKTEISSIEQVDKRAMEVRNVKVGLDHKGGFVGTKVVSDSVLECTNFDKLLVIYKDGTYKVLNIPEKQYIQEGGKKIAYVGIADKKTVFNVAYSDPKTHYAYAKRFIISKFIIDREYNFLDAGMELEHLSTNPKEALEVIFVPKQKQKLSKQLFDVSDVLVKGVSAKGVRIANRQVKKIKVIKDSDS